MNNKANNSNFILAVVLSAIILIGYQQFYVRPHQEQYRQQVLAESKTQKAKQDVAAVTDSAAPRPRAEVIGKNPRVKIATPELEGSINLKGARIDDLSLVRYRETIDPASPNIILLSPSGSADPEAYYADFSWLADAGTKAPDADSEWKAAGGELTPDHPVTLTWDSGRGLSFARTISVDDHFMFTVHDRVTNKGSDPVTLYPAGLVARQGNPVQKSISVLHEGPLGAIGGPVQDYKYKELMEGKQTQSGKGGWLGITDKYWLVALIPQQDESLTADFLYNRADQHDPDQGWFQTDYRGGGITVAPGASAENEARLFAGAKQVRLLDAYGDKFGIPHFDRAIDFGWFYFLTKPFLYLLAWLGHWFGSLGIAILVFTVLLKLVTLPLSLKSYHSMSRMKALQPEMKRIQERYKDDRVRQSQEMMEFYKKEKVNPMAGCLPQVIQIPIFFALYKVLYVSIELRQAPFYGWIHDMAAPDPTSWVNLFGLAHWGIPAQYALNLGFFAVYLPPALHIGLWPFLMGLSMFLQQRLSPQPPDKTQARMFMFMPIFFTYLLSSMPSGLVIYWTWSNLISIAQQAYIMRKDSAKRAAR